MPLFLFRSPRTLRPLFVPTALCAVLGLSLLGTPAGAQTQGIGEVVLVEMKAREIEGIRERARTLRAEATRMEAGAEERRQRLISEVVALIRERDAHLADLRRGFFCSECERSRHQIETKGGENFHAHIRRVGGRIVPASNSTIIEAEAEFRERIDRLEAQILQLDRNVTLARAKRREADTREATIPGVCQALTAHGPAYTAKVTRQAQADQNAWAAALMEHVARQLIGEDRVVIGEARKQAARATAAEALETARARLRREDDAFRAERERQIAQLQAQAQGFEATHRTGLGALDNRLREVDARLRALAASSPADAAAAEERAAEQARLQAERATLQQRRATLEAEHDRRVAENRTAVQRRRDELFEHQRSASTRDAQAVARVEADRQRALTDADAEIARGRAAVAGESAAFRAKEVLYGNRLNTFLGSIDAEVRRMQTAGQRVGCPVTSTARGDVTLHWNRLLPCVRYHLSSKPLNTNVSGAYCTGGFATQQHLGTYRTFISGLNAADLAAVRRNTNASWLQQTTGQ
jgi:hypothetical protein